MEDVVNLLNTRLKPISIFLYGSRARTDYLKRSDFEIGVLFSKENYVGRSEIKKLISKKGFNIYPFEYEDFLHGKIDTPFQKNIYLREIILSGKTLSGKKVVEETKPPQISILDLIQELRLNLGYALASVISYRNGENKTASLEFYKSCLFATRTLIMLTLRVFPLTYAEILNLSQKLDLREYKKLVETAYHVRNGKKNHTENDLFHNVSYLNEFIEPLLLDSFNKRGNIIVIQ